MLRSPVLLAALADAAVPNLRPKKVEGLAVAASAVYQTAIVTGHDGREWVVRSALTGAAGAELAASDALVQLLRRRIDFDVPKLAGSARPKEGPAVAVYENMRGATLDWAELRGRTAAARAIGEALAALHGVDPIVVEEAGLPSYDAETYRQRLLADLDRAADTKHVPPSLLGRWEETLEAPEMWKFSTTVTHGPLRGEDVHVDEGVVSGISGWEHAGVADPARDFSLLWRDAPRQAFDTAFEAYAAARSERPDRHIERRIQLMGEMELAYALLQSRTLGDERLVDFHTAALEALAARVDSAPSLVPPQRSAMTLDAEPLDVADMEAVGSDDLAEESELTVEIPVRTGEGGSTAVTLTGPKAKNQRSKLPARESSAHDDTSGRGGSTRVTPQD